MCSWCVWQHRLDRGGAATIASIARACEIDVLIATDIHKVVTDEHKKVEIEQLLAREVAKAVSASGTEIAATIDRLTPELYNIYPEDIEPTTREGKQAS